MSGPVVLVALLSLFQAASTLTRCNYNDGLITPYLADKEGLYCFDEEGFDHVVDENAKLCSEGVDPRSDGMDVRCADGFILVGYSFYPCDTNTGVLATFIGNDETLTQYSACVADADVATVCTGVDVASGTSKLMVDQEVGPVANIDLVPENSTEYVSYAMACDDGFGFQADVSSPVYGYCSGNTDGINEFTLDGTDGCYELCSADNTNIEGVSLNLEAGSRHGATVSAEVVCPSGFEIAFNAAEFYDFTCTGLLEGEANNGVFNCEEENCPNCLAQCPADPEAEDITNFGDVENLAGVTNLEPGASGQTVMAGVACAEGFALAEGAEDMYDFQCNSNENDTEASSGRWTMVNDLPICHPVCPSDSFAAMEFVETVTITDDGVEGQTVRGVVTCDNGYALEGNDKTFDFVCSNGSFVAVGAGPECLKECIVPDAGNFTFYTVRGGVEEQVEGGEVVRPGRSHIRVACQNETLNLIGSPTMSCNKEGDLEHDDVEAPFCADAEICTAPNVIEGDISTKNNVIVGEVYTITCKPSHWFDTKTVKEYNPGNLNEDGFSMAEVTCQGEEIPDFTCYFGCLAPDFQGGAVFPDMAEEGQAPYEIGAVVEFQCLETEGALSGDAQATCDVGGIGSPVCGACSFALSLFLSVALFFLLL
ncbi:hypothetical protein ACHWQZ_G001191 [Mnemiopsis leidyi]